MSGRVPLLAALGEASDRDLVQGHASDADGARIAVDKRHQWECGACRKGFTILRLGGVSSAAARNAADP